MTTAALRLNLALVTLAGAVALTGCATPTSASKTHPTMTASAPDSAPGSGTLASDEMLPPNEDGHSTCPAYDSWRPGSGGAGITVTYWFEGVEPVTVAVRQPGNTDLTQTVDNDASQRHHDFEFIDVDPTAVTDVLVTTGDTVCYVRAGPRS